MRRGEEGSTLLGMAADHGFNKQKNPLINDLCVGRKPNKYFHSSYCLSGSKYPITFQLGDRFVLSVYLVWFALKLAFVMHFQYTIVSGCQMHSGQPLKCSNIWDEELQLQHCKMQNFDQDLWQILMY